MKKITFRIFVALITFIIGIFVAWIYFFVDSSNIPENLYYSIKGRQDTLVACPVYIPDQELNENEEYAVYSAILADNRYNSEKMVVSEYTIKGFLADTTNLTQQISGLSQEIVDDYQAKNIDSQKLENNFTVSSNVIFISEKQTKQIFRKGEGWNNFYKKYPQSSGLISFSNIGFNQERTQALVYVGINCGWLCGDGSFKFLQKTNGKWIIKDNVELWVS